ncbi:membrane protein [Brevundimonas sp. GN22]
MWVRRFIQLLAGLSLFGLGAALMVRAHLGLDPWNVFHQGLAGLTGLSLGVLSILSGVVVMLLWIPLRQKPGVGTIMNILVIGLTLDLFLWLIPEFDGWPLRVSALLIGVVLTGVGSAAYIGAGMGTGPRDGLMVGLNRKFGWSIRVSRMLVELVVLAIGWLLGGVVGVGTVVFALSIGPLVQFFLPYFQKGWMPKA